MVASGTQSPEGHRGLLETSNIFMEHCDSDAVSFQTESNLTILKIFEGVCNMQRYHNAVGCHIKSGRA